MPTKPLHILHDRAQFTVIQTAFVSHSLIELQNAHSLCLSTQTEVPINKKKIKQFLGKDKNTTKIQFDLNK